MTASRAAASPASRHAWRGTSAARRARWRPTALRSSRPVRSRAAIRSISRCFQWARSSASPPGEGGRSSSRLRTSTASSSLMSSRVRKRLAAGTVTRAWRKPATSSIRSRNAGRSSQSTSTARRTAAGSADRSIASSSWRRTGPVSRRPGNNGGVPRIRIAACQVNPTVGDLDGNTQLVLDALDEAEAAGADVAVFPELVLTGYPPEDLLLKPGFIADNHEALQKVAARTGGCAAVIGFVDAGRDLFNAAAVCAHGAVQGVYPKRLLPNYAVFDEQRYFAPGRTPLHLFRIAGVLPGISICEDAWSPTGPIAEHAAGGAELVLNINASPFYAGRLRERETMLSTRANDASCALVYVNQVGGQDELVFDGASLVIDSNGDLIASAPQFVEDLLVIDLDVHPVFRKRLLDPRGRAVATPLPLVV